MTDFNLLEIFNPTDPVLWALFAALAGGIFFFIRFVVRLREPPGKRIDRFICPMPHQGHLFCGVFYEYPEARDMANFEALRTIPNLTPIADILIQHKDNLYYYLVKYDKHDRATLQNGTALVMMHKKIDSPELGERLGSSFDILRGGRTHDRMIQSASRWAAVFKDAGEYDGRVVDLIYFVTDLPGQNINLIQNPKATMEIAAQLKVFTEVQKKSQYNELARRAAEHKLAESNRDKLSLTNERNESFGLLSQKRYDNQSEVQNRPSMSPWLAAGIMLFVMFATVQIMSSNQQAPQYPITTQMMFSAIIGFGIVALANYFMGKRTERQTSTVPLQG